jgi:outer membrane protein TolC
LNAQDALAQARLQVVNAEFGVRSGAVGLARAVGDVSEVGAGR